VGGLFVLAEVGDGDVGVLLGEGSGDGPAYAEVCAGDECPSAGEQSTSDVIAHLVGRLLRQVGSVAGGSMVVMAMPYPRREWPNSSASPGTSPSIHVIPHAVRTAMAEQLVRLAKSRGVQISGRSVDADCDHKSQRLGSPRRGASAHPPLRPYRCTWGCLNDQ
jgi:hypothetical protein